MYAYGLSLMILSAVDMLIAIETKTKKISETRPAELECSTNLQYPVVWHLQQSDGMHEVFLGGEISKEFKGMFSLTGNQSLGEYNLYIPSADSRYAGNYTCIDDEGFGSAILSIQLSIMAPPSNTEETRIGQPIIFASNLENTEKTTSHSDNVQSNNIGLIIALTVAFIFVVLIIVAVIVVYVTRSKLYTRRTEKDHANKNAEANWDANKDAEANSPPNLSEKPLLSSESSSTPSSPEGSDSSTTQPLSVNSGEESDTIKDTIVPPSFERLTRDRMVSTSSESSGSSGGSESSTTPLVREAHA